jgi:hypothetical protein
MPREKLIQARRGTAVNWTTVDPILELGEAGYETDTNKLKYGDGSTIWSLLDYFGDAATPTEEEVIGTASENATMTGTVNLDLDTFSYFEGILTGSTTVTVTNPPTVNKSIVRNLMIKSTTTQALTLPVSWTIIGEYLADGSDNYFTIIFSNLTTAGERVVCYISQA